MDSQILMTEGESSSLLDRAITSNPSSSGLTLYRLAVFRISTRIAHKPIVTRRVSEENHAKPHERIGFL